MRTTEQRWGGAGGNRRGLGWVLWVAGLLMISGLGFAGVGPVPNVGMEGAYRLEDGGALLEARAFGVHPRLVVRVAGVTVGEGGRVYDLRYTGFEPGVYDLRGWLRRVDGSSVSNLPVLEVRVGGLLPERHDGALTVVGGGEPGVVAGYFEWLLVVAVIWCGMGVVLWRTRPVVRGVESVAGAGMDKVPTVAEQLRPLVEAAAAGGLGVEGKARLERLLLVFWRDRLGLGGVGTAEALGRLRAHPEAGELLGQVEAWLHRPRGEVPGDLERLLGPYQGVDREGMAGGNGRPEVEGGEVPR